MITSITFPISKIFYGRINQKNSSDNQIRHENRAVFDLESPKSLYNRQIINSKKVSDVNFGFHLTTVPGFHCPCCGKLMYTRSEVSEFTNILKDAKGVELSEFLAKHIDNFHPVEKDVAMIFMNLSSLHPEKDIKQLLQHTVESKRGILESVQTDIVLELKKHAKNLSPQKQKEVFEHLDKIQEIIVKGKDGLPFKRKKVLKTIELFYTFEENTKDKAILLKMMRKAAKLPSSAENTNAFICKYMQDGKTNEDIALRLFESNLSTKEHLKLKLRNSKDVEHGSDKIQNLIPMCNKCNNERNDMSYYLFVKKYPEMRKNIKNLFKEIQIYIIDQRVRRYYTYPLRIKKTLSVVSLNPSGEKACLDIDVFPIRKFLKKLYSR